MLGFGWQKGSGLNSGDITDLEAAERAIRACVGQAEDMADTRLRSVTVNLTCGQPESRLFNVNGRLAAEPVTEHDIRGVVNEGAGARGSRWAGTDPCPAAEFRRRRHRPCHRPARPVLHDIERPAACDRCSARRCARWKPVSAVAIWISRTLCPRRWLRDCPPGPGRTRLGATIIDMGGGTTSMAVFADKQMMHTAQLAIGGLHVTRIWRSGCRRRLSMPND